jgi:hypothetical protein
VIDEILMKLQKQTMKMRRMILSTKEKEILILKAFFFSSKISVCAEAENGYDDDGGVPPSWSFDEVPQTSISQKPKLPTSLYPKMKDLQADCLKNFQPNSGEQEPFSVYEVQTMKIVKERMRKMKEMKIGLLMRTCL